MSERDDQLASVHAQLRRWSASELEAALVRFQRQRTAVAELTEKLPPLRASLRRWSPEQLEAALGAFRLRRQATRGTGQKLAMAGLLLAAAAALLLYFRAAPRSATRMPESRAGALEPAPVPRLNAPAAASAARQLTLADGSEVTFPDATSQARVVESQPGRVLVAVDSGRGIFRVKHRAERTFLVQVGSVQIEDLGTVFSVERTPQLVSIEVSEGSVRVRWQGHTAELTAGQRGTYPLEATVLVPPGPAVSAPAATNRAPAADATWRLAAREGRYKEAFAQLELQGFGSVHDDPNDLLLAVDVARLSGHAGQAIEPLRDLLRLHRADPRSPAAAFTLGSILLRDVHRPAEAARAFDEAVRLAPNGNLAEDATARAAEASFSAGDRPRAEAAIAHYEARYPRGRYLAFLKRLIHSRD